MLIAHLSDTHIVAHGQKTLGIAPMAENLAASVAYLNRLRPHVDVVLVTGDLTDRGDAAATGLAADLLGQLDCPYYIVPGNHDDPAILHAQFGTSACPSSTASSLDFVIDDHELRLIGLDSTRTQAPGGELGTAQLDWLDKALEQPTPRPSILFLHHPPLKCGVPETDLDGFIGSEPFARIIARHPEIERILCGHIHLPVQARWNGTIISTAPGGGMHLALDLMQRGQSQFVLEPPGCLLHHWTAQKNLISHMVFIHETDGPYPFTRT